jgi:Zn finger protein HypA/HybF involved in hydrogenase expression
MGKYPKVKCRDCGKMTPYETAIQDGGNYFCPDCERKYWDDDGPSEQGCDTCGGEGFVEYLEHPELWDEDCPSLKNHLVICPTCGGNG